MNTLTIDEYRWACRSLPQHGESRLLNSAGYKCCLGFLTEACGFTREEMWHAQTPAYLADKLRDVRRLPPEVVEVEGTRHLNRGWTLTAMQINDEPSYSHEQRKELLVLHFRIIGIALNFINASTLS